MKNRILPFAFFLLCFLGVSAQTIWTNPITGTNPSSDNPYTTGDVAANVVVFGIGRGTGVAAESSQDRYNAKQWNTTALSSDSYFTFKLEPLSGEYIHFSSLEFTYQRSNTGPVSFALRASDDGYVSDIATGTIQGSANEQSEDISLPAARFNNIASQIEFRLYAWGATNKAGTYSVNSFTFKGVADDQKLPVSFGKISGSLRNQQLQLSWETQCETNNDHFEIQISKDGKEFFTMGTVASKALDGCSGQPIAYSFSESLPVVKGLFSLLLVFGLFAGWGRRRKLLLLSFSIGLLFLAIACNKNADHIDVENSKLYARIMQVDKDGAKTPSKVIILEEVQ